IPDDLIVVDLASVNPDVRNMRLRGRLEGRRLVPYWSRAEIEAREPLSAPVIAWTSDPVELFFLQIQGSGQVRLPDGERMRIGYADQNGHPFRSLGRYLVERGEMTLDQASMQTIKAWAAANPHKLREALNVNPSYVFFREVKGQEGPIGAQNVPLTEERLERLMVAQDTGGAIRGVVRGDFYWGSGPEAGTQAGRMRNQAKMWLLWPRGMALPRDPSSTCC